MLKSFAEFEQMEGEEIQKRKTEMQIRSKSQVGSATSPEGFMSSTRILYKI